MKRRIYAAKAGQYSKSTAINLSLGSQDEAATLTARMSLVPDKSKTVFSCAGAAIDAAPRCPGVYRFFSEDDVLLYVGKSIDIGTRLNSHFAEAREPGRHQRLMSALQRVDCTLTAGETGALLLENVAIKSENPLYNRRQRRYRSLWTLRLQEQTTGFFSVIPSNFSITGERTESVFGLFKSKRHCDTAIRAIARDEKLCLKMLGIESGRGPCFQHQLGRCLGACVEKEDLSAHNQRLLAAVEHQRILAWPFDGPILLQELRSSRQHDKQPNRQFHLLNHWTYLGTFGRKSQALKTVRNAASKPMTLQFDRDAYRIACRALISGVCKLLDGNTGDEIANPFASYDSVTSIQTPTIDNSETKK